MYRRICHLVLPFTMQTLSINLLPCLWSVPAFFVSLILQALIFQHPLLQLQAVSQGIQENISHVLEPRPQLQG